MSDLTPRTPLRPATQPTSPPPLLSKSASTSSFTSSSSSSTSTSSTASSPLSSPPSSLGSSPSPASSPSPCSNTLTALLPRLATIQAPGFVSATSVYNEQQARVVATSAYQANGDVPEGHATVPVPVPSSAVSAAVATVPSAAVSAPLAIVPVAVPADAASAALPVVSVPVISAAVPPASSPLQPTPPATSVTAPVVAPHAVVVGGAQPGQSGFQPTASSTDAERAMSAPTTLQGQAAMTPIATGSATPAVGALLPSHLGVNEHRDPIVAQLAVGNTTPNALVLRDSTVVMPEEPAVAAGSGTMPSPTTWVAKLTVKLEYARVAAAVLQFYLALGITLKDVTTWYRFGRGFIVVARAAALAAQEALAAHAADPVGVPAPMPPVPARHYLFGQICDEQFYMRCDGNYRGDTPMLPYNKRFSQTVLTCALGPPPEEYPTLNADYHAGVGALVALLPSNTTVKSGHVYEKLSKKHLRLRHAVFAPRGADQGTAATANVPREFTIQGWHTYSDAAEEARAAIEETHVARPLPAYDVLGNLIPPSRYPEELRGATVLVGFTLIHYDIAERRANGAMAIKCTLCLDIAYLRVVIPPTKYSIGMKRPNIQMSDPVSNAAKKQRA